MSNLWKAKFFILCVVKILVRLQEKFEIDHSNLGEKGLRNRRRITADFGEDSSTHLYTIRWRNASKTERTRRSALLTDGRLALLVLLRYITRPISSPGPCFHSFIQGATNQFVLLTKVTLILCLTHKQRPRILARLTTVDHYMAISTTRTKAPGGCVEIFSLNAFTLKLKKTEYILPTF